MKTSLLFLAFYLFNCGSSITHNSGGEIRENNKHEIQYNFQEPHPVTVNSDDTLSFNYLVNYLRANDGLKDVSYRAANTAFDYIFKNSSRISGVSIRKDTLQKLYLSHLHSYEEGNVFDYWILRNEINVINILKILTNKKHPERVYEEVNRLVIDSIARGIIKYNEIDESKPFDNYWDAQFKSKSKYIIKNNIFVKIK